MSVLRVTREKLYEAQGQEFLRPDQLGPILAAFTKSPEEAGAAEFYFMEHAPLKVHLPTIYLTSEDVSLRFILHLMWRAQELLTIETGSISHNGWVTYEDHRVIHVGLTAFTHWSGTAPPPPKSPHTVDTVSLRRGVKTDFDSVHKIRSNETGSSAKPHARRGKRVRHFEWGVADPTSLRGKYLDRLTEASFSGNEVIRAQALYYLLILGQVRFSDLAPDDTRLLGGLVSSYLEYFPEAEEVLLR